MSENEKKHESQSCCCCQSWKAIFITIALLVIGAVFGHVMTVKHCPMMKSFGGGHCMKAFWDKGDRGERECNMEREFDAGRCEPGCTCPKCSKMGASLSEPNMAGCPMMGQKEERKSRKN